MGGNYIFSLQPTFTQGLIIGQLSILVLLGLVLKYLFLDSTQDPFERSSYHPHVDSDLSLQSQKFHSPSAKSEVQDDSTESTEWLNVLLRQVCKQPPASILCLSHILPDSRRLQVKTTRRPAWR